MNIVSILDNRKYLAEGHDDVNLIDT